MEDHILISEEEDQSTPLPSLSKRSRKDSISAILISNSDPTLQKQPPESSSAHLFVPDTYLSDDFSVIKCSFVSRAINSNRHNKFSGSFRKKDRLSVTNFRELETKESMS
ncbi:unnamed protein product [Arabis nemorensis]|uniref:Uncharacterized protein n=1 Tax=Arabis nemorensis TaxID=586526 RepID=A0A565BAP7_9BRAS|nr:unnamed protein product [Arabis nemorensis]